MKVAEENVIRFERAPDNGRLPRDGSGALSSSMVYIAQRSSEGDLEHDSRGLVVAVLLCMACWAALGFFLLS